MELIDLLFKKKKRNIIEYSYFLLSRLQPDEGVRTFKNELDSFENRNKLQKNSLDMLLLLTAGVTLSLTSFQAYILELNHGTHSICYKSPESSRFV